MINRKMLCIFIFLASLLALCILPRALAADEMTISVYPNYVEIQPENIGQTFTINITITNAHDVAGIQFRVEWNNTVVTCLETIMPDGHFMDPEGVEAAEDNLWIIYNRKGDGYAEYAVTYYDMAAAQGRGTVPRTGDGVLVTLTMNATNPGVTTVNFVPDETIIGDAEGNPLTVTMQDGTINVIPEFTTIIAMIILLTATTTMIALKKINRNY
ncbi:hypothetical protein DRO69_13570, partial [Candidatus Bathyarchaeota archaeon]